VGVNEARRVVNIDADGAVHTRMLNVL
jgi:hypothetical protein